MYTLKQLKNNKSLWSGCDFIPVRCDWCDKHFEVKYGTLYNVIRRDAEGIYCCRKCAGAARAHATQQKFLEEGGKTCKRCGEFKKLDNFSSLPNPPYYRSECKRCHNYKPARKFSLYKEKAVRRGVDFRLSLDNFIFFWSQNCYYCDSEVMATRLDLVDNSKGYILGNVVSCCRECQKFKGELSHREFVNICHRISDNVREK